MSRNDDTGGIFALDLAGVVGWAYGKPGDMIPRFGTWHLSESRLLGPRYVSFENELISALEAFQPRMVVMEAPLPSGSQGNTNVARQQFGLAAYTEGECWRHQIRVKEQPASTVRKAILGRGTFKSGTAKDHVMSYCRAKGWDVPDHNAGDACILWAFSAALELDRMRYEATRIRDRAEAG